MSTITTREEYASVLGVLQQASATYHDQIDATMSDPEYDALKRALVDAETIHPEWVDGQNVDEQVGEGADLAGDVKHSAPMLSLLNVTTDEEFALWCATLGRRVGGDTPVLVAEPKVDGLAMVVRYRDGRPVQMITRGNGVAGEDLTPSLAQVSNLPTGNGFTGEVRGEVVFTYEQFSYAQEQRAANGDAEFQNPRNGVAGAMRGARSRSYDMPTSFITYDVVESVSDFGDVTPASHTEAVNFLSSKGFTTALGMLKETLDTTAENVQALVSEGMEHRTAFPFEIDGIVIKADRYEDRERAGLGSSTPHWAVAYKFPPETSLTVLREVTWSTGRTGNVAPRAFYDTVRIMGSSISFCTLNNPDDIARKNLMLGDHVIVRKAGDVIPEIVSSMPEMRDGTQQPISIPSECPNCSLPLDTSQARLRCPSKGACASTSKVVYAVSTSAWDIDGLGERVVTQLVAAGRVATVADIFRLTAKDLSDLPGSKTYADTPANQARGVVGQAVPLGNTVATKIVANIERAKDQPLGRTITALGITGTGRRMSHALAGHYGSMQALQSASVADLLTVPGVGEVKAELIHDELFDLADAITVLGESGVNLGTEPSPVRESDPQDAPANEPADALAGLKVVVTGSMVGPLADLTRQGMEDLILSNGGVTAGSVSKNTDLLVCGQKAGSKKAKAESLGVRIVSEEEFAQMIARA